MSTEALYIKPDDYYLNLNLEELGQALLFMLYNNLYDYAIFLLEEKIITNNISIPKEFKVWTAIQFDYYLIKYTENNSPLIYTGSQFL